MPVVNLIRFAEVTYTGAGEMRLSTDLHTAAPAVSPFQDIALTTQASRVARRYTLFGTCMAINYRVRLTPDPAGTLAVHSVRLYCKSLGAGVTGWRWVNVPIPPTPEEWSEVRLPIPPTPEEWSEVRLPIPPTPEEWQEVKIVSAPTSPWQWIDADGQEQS